ncbi:glycosyltransferase [Klebsiella pneumoniae]
MTVTEKNWLSWLDSKNNRLLLLMVQALIQRYTNILLNRITDVLVVLFASRMLWSKGLGDLIEAKKILRSKNIHFTLNVAGILVENDKDAISLQVIENWHQQGLINWLGRSNNVCDLIEQSNIVALPSVYSEGVPRIFWKHLLWVALIAYDVGGCDSLIIDNDNGIIVKSNSPEELADKLAFLLSNPKARVEMGIKGGNVYKINFLVL